MNSGSDENRNERPRRKPIETRHDLGLLPMLIGGLCMVVFGGAIVMAFV